MQQKDWIVGGVLVLALVVGLLGWAKPAQVIDATKVDVNAIARAVYDAVKDELPLGGSAGPLHTEKQEFVGGVVYGNNIATSSRGSITLTAGDFRDWVEADVVILSTEGAEGTRTLTLTASSSVPDVLPNVGDSSKTCIYNATTSATTFITFAAGTGIDFEVASSSATALGSLRIGANSFGCFTFVRENVTATTFDIAALYTAFEDAD